MYRLLLLAARGAPIPMFASKSDQIAKRNMAKPIVNRKNMREPCKPKIDPISISACLKCVTNTKLR